MKPNLYLFQTQINSLKTPTQVLFAKEKNIQTNIQYKAIQAKEERLPVEIMKELYPQNHYDIPEYKQVAEYKQAIEGVKWYINHEQNNSSYFTTFNLGFIIILLGIIFLTFVLKKYKKFIEKLEAKNEETKHEDIPKTKICPYCSEEILYTARRCKYCHSNLNRFEILKNTQFHKIVLYVLVAIIGCISACTIICYLHPICTYLFYILMSCFDPIYILWGLLVVNIFNNRIALKYKILSGFVVLISMIISLVGTHNYNANMWEMPKIILMHIVALGTIIFVIKGLKDKYKKGFTFFFIWFFISIFLSILIHYLYVPIILTNTNENIEINTIKEKDVIGFDKWENIIYENNYWIFYPYQDSSYIDVKEFQDVETSYNNSYDRPYSLKEINYIHSHDMTNYENQEQFDKIFNGADSIDVPNALRLGARVFSSKPEMFTLNNKDISISYDYTAACGLANCVELNVDILKADKSNKIHTVFSKSYKQLNDGPFYITSIDNANPLIKIEGQTKKIFIEYLVNKKEIKEYIISN